MKTLNKYSIALSVVFSIFIIGVGFVYAQVDNSKIKDITYPIAELGSCADKAACKTYCDNTDNIASCAAYAAGKGWISKEEAANAKEFAGVLKGKGPGGCTDKESCKNYCEDTTHIDECLSFAKEHNLLPKAELEEAQKVSKAMKDGGKLPGDCRNKTACDAYCKNAQHAEECLAFAEKAGFMSPKELAEAKKVIPLMKAGQTPGKCTSKDECEAYCKDDAHFNECINFAEKAGFMSKEELSMAKKTGGKGPGGCKSKDQCEKFCNDAKNQTACFNFAKEHDLIPADKLEEMKDGMARLKAGLEQAPPEVVQCLKDNLGQNIISDIEAGTLVPGPEIGDRVKSCFEQYMPKVREKMNDLFQRAPPAILNCLEKNVGKEDLEKMKNGEAPDPAVAEKIKSCFGQMDSANREMMKQVFDRLPPQAVECIKNKIGSAKYEQLRAGTAEITEDLEDVFSGCTQGVMKNLESQFTSQLQQMPPQVQDCIVNKLGGDLGQKMQTGALDQNAMQAVIKECASQMQQPQGMAPALGPSLPPLPIEIKNCVVGKLGADFEQKIQTSEMDPTKLQAVIKECASQMQLPTGGMMPPTGGQIPGGMMPLEGQIPGGYPTGTLPTDGQYPGMPLNDQLPLNPTYPTGGQPPSGMGLPGEQIPMAPPTTQGPVLSPELCGQFSVVPSCDMVPEGAREICKQCKGQ